MAGNDRDLKSVRGRNRRALQLRPTLGRGTATTVATLRPGSLTVDLTDGGWSLVADSSRGEGGTDLGPDPGVLLRGALAACLTMGYQMFASEAGIEFETLRVTVEADYDARGQYGIEGAPPPGYSAMRVLVDATSDAPEAVVRQVIERADRHSPILDDIVRGLDVRSEVRVGSLGAARG
jgi:uncharacterized OsmC-like protein